MRIQNAAPKQKQAAAQFSQSTGSDSKGGERQSTSRFERAAMKLNPALHICLLLGLTLPIFAQQPAVQQWGLPGDIAVPGDYNGDGITDFAIYRPGTGEWWILPSSGLKKPAPVQVRGESYLISAPTPAVTLAYTPLAAGAACFRNGLRLTQGVDADYTVLGNVVTFSPAATPQARDRLTFDYEALIAKAN